MAVAKKVEVEQPVVEELTHLQQQMLKLMSQPKKKEKSSGLGFMWNNTTTAVGVLSGTVAEAATATRLMASLGVAQAMQANMEADQELLSAYGIEANGYEAVEAAKLLKKLILGR
jgi:hypothetical protein